MTKVLNQNRMFPLRLNKFDIFILGEMEDNISIISSVDDRFVSAANLMD